MVTTRIVSSLLPHLTSDDTQKEGEATVIIEALRPFIYDCIITQIKGINFEWLTYHLTPGSNHSNINDELFFIEVKRPGKYNNGHLESNLVKLDKEMQIALNKSILRKVASPEVVGLLIEGYTATTYKMDLKFNGQYRMMELSRFHFVRECIDDILLVPAVMEKLFQIQTIIQKTLEELYDSLAK
ncbi:hypothetical protein G6F43_008679 [Rhizopus delemar]|nr:hypothetical protein G6F43_008679 [Rhizopus delemar]